MEFAVSKNYNFEEGLKVFGTRQRSDVRSHHRAEPGAHGGSPDAYVTHYGGEQLCRVEVHGWESYGHPNDPQRGQHHLRPLRL